MTLIHLIAQAATQPMIVVQGPVQSFATVLHDLAEIAGVIGLVIGGLAAWLAKNHGTKIDSLANKVGINEQTIAHAEGVTAGIQHGLNNLAATATNHDAQLTAMAGLVGAVAKGAPVEAAAIAEAFKFPAIPAPGQTVNP